MRKIAAVLFLMLPVLVEAQTVTRVRYDFNDKEIYCDNGSEPCKLTVTHDDSLRFTVCNAPGAILTLSVTAPELPGFRLTADQIKQLGLGGTPPAAPAPPAPPAAPTPAAVRAAYDRLKSAVRVVANWVQSPTAPDDFTSAAAELEAAHAALLGLLQQPASAAGSDVAAAFRAKLKDATVDLFPQIGETEATLATWFSNVADLVSKASRGLSCYSGNTFNIEVPFDIVLTWASTNPLVPAPPEDQVPIRFPTWRFTGSTGFAFSQLHDNHYTTRTVEVTPPQGTTPAVTKRVAVLEERDAYLPEVTGFIHFTKFGSVLGYKGPGSWLLPKQLSVGGGLSTGPSGRVYAGLSWPFGRIGSVTVGVAGGPVKRLSNNVDPDNLGTTDPEASRRDILRTSLFFGISWRIIGATNQ